MLAVTRSVRWRSSSLVMALKFIDRRRRSPSPRRIGSSTLRLPRVTCWAALIRRRIGATNWPANQMPDPDRRQQRGERDHEVHHAVRELQAAAHLAQALVALHAGLRAAAGACTTSRVDAAGDVEVGVRDSCAAWRCAATRKVSRGISSGTCPPSAARSRCSGGGDVGDLLVLEHRHLHRALGIDDVGHGQVAQAGLREHQLAKLARRRRATVGAASSRSLAMLTMSVRMTWPCSSR